MTSIRLAGNMEVLLRILWELLEEKSKERIHVLARCHCVAHGTAAIRITNIDRLVKEDNGSVIVPRVRVVNELEVLVNGGRAELKEQSCKRRTARASVKPQDNGIVLWVVTGFKEP
jgi:hypothetical protein